MKHRTLSSFARPSTSKRYAGTTAVKCGIRHLTSRPGALPRPEQQEPPQALSTMGGTICHRGGAPTRHLQAQDHRRRSLRQTLEHRTTTSLLPLIYAHFILSVSLSTSRSLVTPDPSNGRGLGLTRGLIRVYLSGRHSLRWPFLKLRPRSEGRGNKC